MQTLVASSQCVAMGRGRRSDRSRSRRGRRSDRSRPPKAPKGIREMKISHSVAAMGRYKNMRPAGLKVDVGSDGSGTFKLSNLMSTWGEHHGLTESDILYELTRTAVRKDNGKRFSVRWVAGGDHKITVHPACAASRSSAAALPRHDRHLCPDLDAGESCRRDRPESGDQTHQTVPPWRQHLVQTTKSLLEISRDSRQPALAPRDARGGVLLKGLARRQQPAASSAASSSSSRPRPPQPECLEISSDTESSGGSPMTPPGKHWLLVTDPDEQLWWYYDGPKGKYWMGEGHEKPEKLGT